MIADTVLRRHNPSVTAIALVLDSPHSGARYPLDFDHLPPRAVVRQAEDSYVGELYSAAPAVGATLIEALFPRAYIDANRHLCDIDPALLSEPWPGEVTISHKTELGIGLVWRLARGGVPMYARKLTVAEIQRRIVDCYEPYHRALADALDERHRQFGAVWHINCHSMPAIGDVMSDDPGRRRGEFVLGDRDGSSCDAEFTHAVASTLRGMGYEVSLNDPYKGVELVRRHGRPAERRHSLQIEINRRLYMDEDTLARNAGFAGLQENLTRLLETLRDFVVGRT